MPERILAAVRGKRYVYRQENVLILMGTTCHT
jgi:hypothetical protein